MEGVGVRFTKALKLLVQPWGFRSTRRSTFIRKNARGFDKFVWSSYPTIRDGCQGQHHDLVIGVRHDTVEDVVNRLDRIRGEANKKSTTTVSCALQFFPLSPEGRYSFFLPDNAPENDILEMASAIARTIEADALPFFTKYSSLAECAAGLNTSIRSRTHHLFNNLEGRMYAAIAAAHLVGQSNFASLVEQWKVTCREELPQSDRVQAEQRINLLLGFLGVQ